MNARKKLIEDYLNGQLDGKELQQFNRWLKEDSSFAEEVRWQQSIHQSLERIGDKMLKTQLLQVEADLRNKGFFAPEPSLLRQSVQSLGEAVTTIGKNIIMPYRMLAQLIAEKRRFHSIAEYLPTPISPMRTAAWSYQRTSKEKNQSAKREKTLEEICFYIDTNDYEKALKSLAKLEEYTLLSPEWNLIKVSLILKQSKKKRNSKQLQEAIDVCEFVLKTRAATKEQKAKAQWYMGLAYWNNKQKREARKLFKQIANEDNHPFQHQAERILQKNKGFRLGLFIPSKTKRFLLAAGIILFLINSFSFVPQKEIAIAHAGVADICNTLLVSHTIEGEYPITIEYASRDIPPDVGYVFAYKYENDEGEEEIYFVGTEHVVGEHGKPQSITVDVEGEAVSLDKIRFDVPHDLAVFKVLDEISNQEITFLQFAEMELEEGDKVKLGKKTGKITSIDENVPAEPVGWLHLLEFGIPIEGGDSGRPLLSADGENEIVGMVTAHIEPSSFGRQNHHVSYASSIVCLEPLIQQIIEGYHGIYLGIELEQQENGITLKNILEESQESLLNSYKGFEISEIDGKPVTTLEEVYEILERIDINAEEVNFLFEGKAEPTPVPTSKFILDKFVTIANHIANYGLDKERYENYKHLRGDDDGIKICLSSDGDNCIPIEKVGSSTGELTPLYPVYTIQDFGQFIHAHGPRGQLAITSSKKVNNGRPMYFNLDKDVAYF